MGEKKLGIDFYEYEGPIPYENIFDNNHKIDLFEIFLKKHNISDSFSFERQGLKATQYVGAIRYKGLTVNVYPKLLKNSLEEDEVSAKKEMMKNLLKMLSYTHKLQIKENEISNFDFSKNNLLDIFIFLFAKDLYKCFERELPFLFNKKESNLPYIKGKIKFNENIKKNSTDPSKIYCQYQIFEFNNLLSQTFKFVCEKLIPITKSPDAKSYLGKVLKQLDAVENKHITINQIQSYIMPRSLEKLERPFNFCKMILSNKTFSINEGNTPNYCILFNMNEVFEEFIAAFLNRNKDTLKIKEVIPQREKFLFQSNTSFDENGTTILNRKTRKTFQDILIEFENGNRLIIDTKYKIINKSSEVSSGDIYQVMAYHHSENSKLYKTDILLLYPFSKIAIINQLKTSGESSFNVNIATFPIFDINQQNMIEQFENIFSSVLTWNN